MRYVVVIEAQDGALTVTGTWQSEYAATLWANANETEESGYTCHVLPVESP